MSYPSHMGRTLVILMLALVAVACGGKEAGTGSTTLTGAGGAGQSTIDGGSNATSDPCREYFEKVVLPCGVAGTTAPNFDSVSALMPKSELSRIEGRFESYCAARLALPGTAFDVAAVRGCVSIVESHGCGALSYEECAFTEGTLPAGAACTLAEQCSSGSCAVPLGSGPPGPPGVVWACGVCAPAPPPLGATCASAGPVGPPGPSPLTGVSCGPRAICDLFGAGTCVPAYRAEGTPCDPSSIDIFKQCADGLFCDGTSSTCSKVVQAAEGQPCWSPGGPACEAPLACRGEAPPMPTPPPFAGTTCQARASAGVYCTADSQCAEGLGCSLDYHCGKLTFAQPAEVCGKTTLCLHRRCPAAGDRCPDIIPDGSPCDSNQPPGATSQCDWFASCIGGTCTLGFPSCG